MAEKRLSRAKRPMWRKAMLQRLSLDDMRATCLSPVLWALAAWHTWQMLTLARVVDGIRL